MKKENKEKNMMDRLIHHVPNEFHLANCQRGSRITRNRKKYTRKEKHKKRWS